MKIDFTYLGAEGWFDPETGEHGFEGEHAVIRQVLANMEQIVSERRTVDDGQETFDLAPEVFEPGETEAIETHVRATLGVIHGVEFVE